MKTYAAVAFVCLTSAATAQTPPPPPTIPVVPTNPDYTALQEGEPVDSRQNENKDDHPLYPQQTRAPYHKTAPYQTTEITGALPGRRGPAFPARRPVPAAPRRAN